ncbi:MAG: hydrogenase maturation nickel metallochaperone HypA [Solobacterium sp.]|nr:hydrogenase maturation nickel metallochaperone HypA [Solobacterium sp.]
MHEISVLHSAVELAEATAKENGVDRLSYITLEVGELSGYLPVFFEKYYPVVIENRSMFDGCRLNLLTARGEALCLDCNAIYHVLSCRGVCPKCSSRFKKILGGQEFILKEIGFE